MGIFSEGVLALGIFSVGALDFAVTGPEALNTDSIFFFPSDEAEFDFIFNDNLTFGWDVAGVALSFTFGTVFKRLAFLLDFLLSEILSFGFLLEDAAPPPPPSFFSVLFLSLFIILFISLAILIIQLFSGLSLWKFSAFSKHSAASLKNSSFALYIPASRFFKAVPKSIGFLTRLKYVGKKATSTGSRNK